MRGVLLAERFRISERLGSGAMGEVWSAKDARMRRDVAVKLVQALRVEEGDTQARFQREVHLAGRLSHQNIVTVHDHGEELVGGRRTLYVVMELVPGVSLRRKLQESERPPWPTAVGWARQIAQALHVAHSRGVIHRDIKPANVLLTPEGTIKVLDFGVAKFIGDTLTIHELTATGALMGSPPYMSPEQAEGDREVGHRSDLYSLGCLLYHAVTGEPPFTATSPLAVLRMQVDKTPVAPSDRTPGLPRSLSDLIMSLLAKRPEDRPADAATVYATLSTLLVDHVVTLPEENPLDVTQLGLIDPLAGRVLERAWQIWVSTERHSASVREEADRSRGESEYLLHRAHAEAQKIIAGAEADRPHPEAGQPSADAVAQGERIRGEARREAVQQIEEAAKSAEELLAKAKADADELRQAATTDSERVREEAIERATRLRTLAEETLDRSREDAERVAGERKEAAAIRERAVAMRDRVESEIEELHERARREAADAMKTAGERCDALVKAAEEQLAEARATSRDIVSEASSEAGKVRISAVRKAEGLLKEAEQKRSAMIREAGEVKAEATREAERTLEEGRRELEIVLRKREDVNAEVSRVQDVLEALESFESPSWKKNDGGTSDAGMSA
ncbi:protein kinase [Streptomyces sp. NPDC048441]|uniref:protein kinase domain-containing protein n=1 Tax=Streptomyces sp. NPDC048441 TaxID=3365552 RepID=UPI0037132C59